MAVRNIITLEDDVLRKKSKTVTNFDEKLIELLDDMKETLIAADGAGLAAVQIGILKRIVVISVNGMYLELINPEIIKASGKQIEEEACLSVPGKKGIVERPEKVTVKAVDRYGYDFTITGESLLAKAFCHEIDHLDGILYIDKATKIINCKG